MSFISRMGSVFNSLEIPPCAVKSSFEDCGEMNKHFKTEYTATVQNIGAEYEGNIKKDKAAVLPDIPKLTVTNPSRLQRLRPASVTGTVASILLDPVNESTTLFCTEINASGRSSSPPLSQNKFVMTTPEKSPSLTPQQTFQTFDIPPSPTEFSPFKLDAIRKINSAIKNLDYESICSIVESCNVPIPGALGPHPSLKPEDPPIVVASTLLKGPSKTFALKAIKYFLIKGACPDICDHSGYSAFHWAAVLGSVEGMRVLHEGKADSNIKCMYSGETPLHRACRYGKFEAVSALLSEFGADPCSLNREANQPLDVVATHVGSSNAKATVNARDSVRTLFFSIKPSMATLILYHPDCLDHRTVEGHQESPRRINAILKHLMDENNFEPNELKFCDAFPRASFETVRRAHSSKYVRFVYKLSQRFLCKTPRSSRRIEAFTPRVQEEVQHLPTSKSKPQNSCDTNFSNGSLSASLRSAGSVCFAIDKVIKGENRNAFCVVRPPGHHAGWDGYVAQSVSCGFCIFNSVAIGAMHALSYHQEIIKRIAIVDIDVHHGNGTEEIIKKINRPDQLFFSSIHLFDENFYPGSGESDSIEFNIVNIPIAPIWRFRNQNNFSDFPKSYESDGVTGRHAFKNQIVQRLLPSLRAFNPDLVLVSVGYDAAKYDIGNKREGNRNGDVGMDLSKDDYFWAVSQLKSIANLVCKGRLVMVLEGIHA
uniref:histone deacetylase n=1 Tax=Corethron hystrix TaxID=216773 RepID=A0A6U5I784_9STRA|mmetsp:Transcript_32468/g.74732  ORF Transcript_32468/g.74732 Transcript_32468/m.74732 type:complete len:710 (+) Transcript_32468:383-2512(+)